MNTTNPARIITGNTNSAPFSSPWTHSFTSDLTCVHTEFSTDMWVRSKSMKWDRSAALWSVEILQIDKLGWHNFISLTATYQSWENIKYLLYAIHYALNTFPALMRHLNIGFLSMILAVQVNEILSQFYHLTWSFFSLSF